MTRLTHKIACAARRPVEAEALAGFRVLFGVLVVVAVARLLSSGWMPAMYDTSYQFSYPGSGWVKPLPLVGMYIHYVVLAALGVAIAVGFHSRIACGLFAVGFAYTQLVDVTNYLNHNYLVILLAFLLAVLPAHGMFALRPEERFSSVPAWTVWLLRFQIGCVYFFAGIAKLKADWLFDAQPLNIWLSARSDTAVVGALMDDRWLAYAMSWAGCLFDLTIVAWLLSARTRTVAYGVLVAFHCITGYLFNIGMFPLIMSIGALIFFAPSQWQRASLAVRGLLGKIKPTPTASATWVARRPAKYVVALYVAIQLSLPLRHFIYPGDVLWNEDGMRFAWHVMIREKHGDVRFIAQLDNGKEIEVGLHRYITSRQSREMAGQPDLIVQLAKHIGADLRLRGYAIVGMRAETNVSLNGRVARPLIEPTANLLQIDDWGARDWVTATPSDAPIHLRSVR